MDRGRMIAVPPLVRRSLAKAASQGPKRPPALYRAHPAEPTAKGGSVRCSGMYSRRRPLPFSPARGSLGRALGATSSRHRVNGWNHTTKTWFCQRKEEKNRIIRPPRPDPGTAARTGPAPGPDRRCSPPPAPCPARCAGWGCSTPALSGGGRRTRPHGT